MKSVLQRSALRGTFAALFTGVLLVVGDGLHPIWPLMWIAFLPILLFAASETASGLIVFVFAALSMLGGSLPMLYYLHFVLHGPVIAWLGPFTGLSLLFALGVVAFRRLLHSGAIFGAVVVVPALWTVVEYLSSFLPASGTAGSLAYTQLPFHAFLQLASVTGPWGLTFLLLLFPSTIVTAEYLRRTKPRAAAQVLGSTSLIFIAVLLFGAARLMRHTSAPSMKVALLASDSVLLARKPADTERLVRFYAQQAQILASKGARLIVMPEKVGILLDENAAEIDAILQATADRTKAVLVIGMLHTVASSSFNEARVYTPDQPVTTYHKQHMLPPMESALSPGTSLTILHQPAGQIAVAICKDLDFVHPALDYGRAGVALLLDPAWDFNVDGIWHGHIAIMRGVEDGYAVAHAAKQGLLTITDDRGRILAETRSDGEPFASLLADVPLHHDSTIFARFGAWFPLLAGLLLFTALAQLIRARSR